MSGRVLDANTGKPLAAISVYLDNTSIGTTTDSKGEFIIRHIPPAKYKLVASGISFRTFSKIVDTRDTMGYMTIELTREADLLQGAVVSQPDPDGWAKWGQLFINVFVGTSPDAKECHLLNHEVLKFKLNDDSTLTVYANKAIQLHNEALGYDITYDLDDLTYSFYTGVVLYSGHIFFKDLSLARSGSKVISWRQNRREVYKGSLLHFMRSFYRNTLQTEGFQMHSLAKVINREKQRVKELPDSIISHAPISVDSVGFAADSTTAGFYFPDSLEVSYILKKVPAGYKRFFPAARREPYPISQLVFVNKRPVYVLSNGFFYKGADLKMTGYWGWAETAGTSLPYDYDPGQ